MNNSSHGVELRLRRKDRYLHGPTPDVGIEIISNDEILQTVHRLQFEIASWSPDLTRVLT